MGNKKFTLHTYEKFIEGIIYTPIIPQRSFNISKLINSKKDSVTADQLFDFIATQFPEIQSDLVIFMPYSIFNPGICVNNRLFV